MSKVLKALMRDELKDKLDGADGGLLINAQKLDSEKTYAFRSHMHGKSLKFTVLRNALARMVLEEQGYDRAKLDEILKGPVGCLYSKDEEGSAQAAARAFADWKKATKDKDVEYVGAFLDGQAVGPKEAKTLKDAPTKDQARAMFLGVLQAPITRFIGTIREPAARMVYVLDAIKRKLEEGGEKAE